MNSNGTWTTVANLSVWSQSHPTAVMNEGDFEPDGTPYSMVRVRGDLSGAATIIAEDLFFPTGMTLGSDGALCVSNFGFGPPPIGLGMILRLAVE